MNEYIPYILWALGVACSILGWFARQLFEAARKLRSDLSVLEVQMNRDYVRYDRMQDAIKPVMDALHEIKETLKTKVDK